MSKVLESIQRYRKIEDVTSTKDEPPPVYLMDEICEEARSTLDGAQSIADHVKRRLENKSPIVKYKALRLTKHLCNKGCGYFQRSMQKYASIIRELVSYRGEQDPFKGDIPNQRVRDTAKEVLDVLYASLPGPASSSSSGMQGRIQGFGNTAPPGSTSSGSGGGGGSSSGGGLAFSSGTKMVGFGSNNYPPPGQGQDLTSSVSSAVSNLGTNISGISNNISGMIRNTWQPPVGTREGLHAGGHHRTGSASSYTSMTGGEGSYPSSAHITGTSTYTSPSAVLGSEEQLVDGMCTPGGMRLAPDPEDLRKFVEAASSMDGLRLGELLRGRMESTVWQQQLRALYALEAVLQHGMTQSCGEVAVMFQSDITPVRKCISHPQQSVRERAAKVLKLLINETVGEEALQQPALSNHGAAASSTAAASPAPDLLGGELSAPATSQPAAAASAIDLLGDLAPSSSVSAQPSPSWMQAPAAPAPAAAHPFDNLASAVPTAAASQGSLGLAVAGQAAPAAGAPATVPAAAAAGGSRSVPLDDFFSSLSVSSTAPAPVAAAAMPNAGSMGMGMGAPTSHSWTGAPGGTAMPGLTPGMASMQAAAAGDLLGFGGLGMPSSTAPPTSSSMMGLGNPAAAAASRPVLPMAGANGFGAPTPYGNLAGQAMGAAPGYGGYGAMGAPAAAAPGGMSPAMGMGLQQPQQAMYGIMPSAGPAMGAGAMGGTSMMGGPGVGASSMGPNMSQGAAKPAGSSATKAADSAFDFVKDAFKM